MDVCTIIAKNYVAHARVLARSFAEHHPDSRFHVLVIDDLDGYIRPEDEPFTLVSREELEIERFAQMAGLYDVLELSTALKPWLLRWVLDRSFDGVAVYLDPDMRIYAPLDELFARVHRHRLVLCPHNLDPIPRDGRRPNEQDILIAGAYNLGFIGIGSGDFADELLRWWSKRLETDCLVDPERGLFVDQRWIDLVPGMAPSCHLLRDRGVNVAYWNLVSRPISRSTEGVWMAGVTPLRLFHFSGFDHDRPNVLSRHQDRIRVDEHRDLAQLCLDYARELREQGAGDVMGWPYTHGSAPSGLKLTPDIRRAYRELCVEGGLEQSIFTPGGEAALIGRLNAPAAPQLGGGVGVTHYLASLHEHHAHLHRAFPALGNVDGPRYLEWVRKYSRGEVPQPLVPPIAAGQAPAQSAATPAAHGPPFGVNVAGYLNAELGVGEVARRAIAALDAGAVPVLPVALTASASRHGHTFAHRGLSLGGFPINLVCVNADALPAFADEIGPEFFKGRHTIGWWWWELSQFPERWLDSFRYVDELWAGSRFVADALAAVSRAPVTRVRVPVTVDGSHRSEPGRFGLPAGFSFLFSYDYSSVLARKNPLGAIEAFLRAFPEPREAILVLKSINAEHHREAHARVRRATESHRHIVVLENYLEPVDKDRLVASCDCYLSLHRSEGFGLTMAEAMFAGKPVIATGYSGNLDFMTPDNSWLVDYELTAVGAGADPYAPGARWADPDLEHAAALMREVVAEPAATRRRAQRGAQDIRRTHSPVAAGIHMAGLLRDIATRLPKPRGGSEFSPALEHTRTADRLLRTGSQPAAASTAGNARRFARRLLLRVMRPHIAHQRQVDRALIDALEGMSSDIRGLTARGFAVEALTLHGPRDLERRMPALIEAGLAPSVDQIGDFAEEAFDLEPADGGGGYPAAPREPWSHEYNAAHAAFVGRALDDASLLASIHQGAPLPAHWGVGFDERVVEFPWLASRRPAGTVLDAGSTLNHRHVLQRLRPQMDALHIVTLAPEERAFPKLDISYLFADLRKLPLNDEVYDQVISLSTLEHVGLDLGHFGADGDLAEDPQSACLHAVDELRRVLRPGGEALLTVPVGRPERFEWVRALSLDELDAVIERFEPVDVDVTYFRHDDGWQRAGREAVAGARYRDHLSLVEPRDRVVAAEAVACVALTVGASAKSS